MSDNLKNIKSEEIKLNKDGEVEMPEELQSQVDDVAGGISPEESEEEGNNGCTNNGCVIHHN